MLFPLVTWIFNIPPLSLSTSLPALFLQWSPLCQWFNFLCRGPTGRLLQQNNSSGNHFRYRNIILWKWSTICHCPVPICWRWVIWEIYRAVQHVSLTDGAFCMIISCRSSQKNEISTSCLSSRYYHANWEWYQKNESDLNWKQDRWIQFTLALWDKYNRYKCYSHYKDKDLKMYFKFNRIVKSTLQ